MAIVVQIPRDHGWIHRAVDDEDPPIGLDGRDRGAAAVEEDEVRPELDGEPGALVHVREGDRARQAAAAAAAAHRRHAR